jgi:hypothetical protein
MHTPVQPSEISILTQSMSGINEAIMSQGRMMEHHMKAGATRERKATSMTSNLVRVMEKLIGGKGKGLNAIEDSRPRGSAMGKSPKIRPGSGRHKANPRFETQPEEGMALEEEEEEVEEEGEEESEEEEDDQSTFSSSEDDQPGPLKGGNTPDPRFLPDMLWDREMAEDFLITGLHHNTIEAGEESLLNVLAKGNEVLIDHPYSHGRWSSLEKAANFRIARDPRYSTCYPCFRMIACPHLSQSNSKNLQVHLDGGAKPPLPGRIQGLGHHPRPDRVREDRHPAGPGHWRVHPHRYSQEASEGPGKRQGGSRGLPGQPEEPEEEVNGTVCSAAGQPTATASPLAATPRTPFYASPTYPAQARPSPRRLAFPQPSPQPSSFPPPLSVAGQGWTDTSPPTFQGYRGSTHAWVMRNGNTPRFLR